MVLKMENSEIKEVAEYIVGVLIEAGVIPPALVETVRTSLDSSNLYKNDVLTREELHLQIIPINNIAL